MLRRNHKARATAPPSAKPQHNHRRNIIGPLAGNARPGEADEERAPAGAVEVAHDPVPASAAALGQIAAADRIGPSAERRGDIGGRAHGAIPADSVANSTVPDRLCGMMNLLLL